MRGRRHDPLAVREKVVEMKTAVVAKPIVETVAAPSTGPNLIRVDFPGQPFAGYYFRGRPCWIASDVGRVLGYAKEGRALINIMRDDWGEMVAGTDVDTLSGHDLAEFKASLVDGQKNWSSKINRSLTVLYQSGLDMVCVKTEKPVGKKLRRFLVDKVFPSLRDGTLVERPKVIPEAIEEIRALREQVSALVDGQQSLQAEVVDLRRRLATGFPSDGLIGERDARVYILGPLRALAAQVALLTGKSVKSVLHELDLDVREAAKHPKARAGNAWAILPVTQFGQARRAIFNLQAKYQPRFDAHARRLAVKSQLTLVK